MNKEKAVDNLINDIEKQYGNGTIMSLDYSKQADFNDGVISTGCFSIDKITGIGGIPRGRIVELYGGESSGKTTLSLHLTVNAQKEGGVVAYIDTENALDVKYAQNLGVDLDPHKFLLSQPEGAEEALNLMIKYVESKIVDLVIIDSVAGLTPNAELENEMEKETMGLQARIIGRAMRKVKSAAKKNKVAIVLINQTRDKIGVMFGDKTDTPGGKSIKFFASMRIQIGRLSTIRKSGGATGNIVKVTIKKNKCAAPFGMTEFKILYGKGIQFTEDIINFLLINKLIQKKGEQLTFLNKKFKDEEEFGNLMKSNKKFNDIVYKAAKMVK